MFYGSLTRLLFFIKRLVSRLNWVFFFFFCALSITNFSGDVGRRIEEKASTLRLNVRCSTEWRNQTRNLIYAFAKIRKGFYENLALKISRLTPLQFEIHTGFCQNVERSLGKSRMNLVWISLSEIYAFQRFKFKKKKNF